MGAQNDFFRNASLFTMNGLVDPRMMSGYVKKKSKKNTEDIGLLFRIRLAMHALVGKMLPKSQS